MNRKATVLLLLFSIAHMADAQHRIPLYIHHFEMKDTLTYKPSFYKVQLNDLGTYKEEVTYDTSGRIDCIFQVWSEKVKRKLVHQLSVII